ncbi:hypothetical protein HanIR_Chr03g0119211 [Helianthus annuus]|nr:hypothetical protein HanIR_Chr03g0119211 [Helianthus annuus]
MPNIIFELPSPIPSLNLTTISHLLSLPSAATTTTTTVFLPLSKMGNCLKPVMRSETSYEEVKAEEAKPLVASTVHDHVALSGDNSCKKRKKVRFKVPSVDAVVETTMRPTRMKKGVRVKVVLTQSELKQILNRATFYDHPTTPPSPPAPPSSSVDQFSGQILVKCRTSRRSSVMCRCRCTWNPVLHTIPECGLY